MKISQIAFLICATTSLAGCATSDYELARQQQCNNLRYEMNQQQTSNLRYETGQQQTNPHALRHIGVNPQYQNMQAEYQNLGCTDAIHSFFEHKKDQ